MSLELKIKQSRVFGKKTLPLDVILGDELGYGRWEVDRAVPDEIGDGEIMVWDPEHVGRGISIDWNKKEKNAVSLHVNYPNSANEFRALYRCVERIMNYWNGKLYVEDQPTSLAEFLGGLDGQLEFNEKCIRDFAGRIMNGEHDSLTIYGAFFPLTYGKEVAEICVNDPAYFTEWIESKHSVDAYYASPKYYETERADRVNGQFIIGADIDYLIPVEPSPAFGVKEQLEQQGMTEIEWNVMLVPEMGAREQMRLIPYAEFLQKLPADKLSRFDENLYLLKALTADELRSF